MPTVTKCFRPVLGKVMRVTALDEFGVPLPSLTEGASLATDGFVTIELSAEIEEGEEIIQKTASGALCVNEKLPDSFKRLTVGITLCGVNPSLLSMMSNIEPYYDAAGTVVGFTQPEGSITRKFAWELWTGVSGDRSASGYLLLPLVNGGTLGELEINGEDAINFMIENAYTQGGNSWGVGPYSVAEGAGTDEVQTLTSSGTPTGGTFKLRVGGQTTAAIVYNATAAAIKAALEALPVIPAGTINATGGPLGTSAVVLTYVGSLGSEPRPLLQVVEKAFTGGTSPDVTIARTTPGVDGAATALPAALDPFDHLLVLLTEIAAPTPDCSPVPMP